MQMTLIESDKKAASAADIQKLLDDTHAMEVPLGVPVLFLDERDFHTVDYNSPDAAQTIRNQFNAKIQNAAPGFRQAYNKMQQIYGPHYTSMLEQENMTEMAFATLSPDADAYAICQIVPHYSIRHAHFANDYKEENFTDPLLAMIISPSEETPTSALPVDIARGSQYYLLWHEIAHTTQADEPQADTIAAMMCRKNLMQSSTVLKRAADSAALLVATSLYNPAFSRYRWESVTLIDHVETMPDSDVNRFTKEDIKRLRFLNMSDYKNAPTKVLRAVLEKSHLHNHLSFSDSDITALTETSEYFLKKWRHKKGQAEYNILQRFHLAVQRDTIGIDAYRDDTLGDKMRGNGYRPHGLPISLPEFLPAP